MRALILGGYGAVGARVCAALRARGHDAIAAGRDAARADRVLDVGDERAYQEAVADVDVVVNASGAENPALAGAATERHVAFVDITATMGYILALERLDPTAPVLLSVGLAPGLTNLLAATVHTAVPGPVDIASRRSRHRLGVRPARPPVHGRRDGRWRPQLHPPKDL
jgi:saccharopine dehydrogenase-like NADP-dependent oxidoreductase